MSCVSQWAHPAGGPYSHAKTPNFTVFFFLNDSFHMHQSLCMCSVLLLWCVNCCVWFLWNSQSRQTLISLLKRLAWNHVALDNRNVTKTKLVVYRTIRPGCICSCMIYPHIFLVEASYKVCPSALFVLSGLHWGSSKQTKREGERERQTVSDFSSAVFLKRSC